MCRLLSAVLILQKAVKAEVQQDLPGAVLGTRLRLPMPEPESRAGGVLETQWSAAGPTLIACSQKNKQKRTQSCVFDQQPHHRWCPPSQFFPHYLARLGFVLPGCALLFY